MSLGILNFLAYIMQFILSTLFFLHNGKSKLNKYIYFGLMLICMSTLGFFNLIIIKTPSIYRTLFSFIYLFVINLIFLDGSFKKKLHLTIIFFFLSFWAEFISAVIYGVLTKGDFSNMNDLTEQRILAVIFWCVLFDNFTLAYMIFNKIIDKKIKQCMISLLLTLAVLHIYLLLGIFYHNKYMFQINILSFGLISAIGIILARIIIYRVLNQFIKSSEEQKKLELFKSENQYSYEYFKLASQNAKEIKILKHELANQIQNAYAIFQNKEEDKELAFSLLHNCEERLGNINNLSFCENTVINTVLSLKFETAKDKGIRTNIAMDNLGDVTIDNMDLCSIYSNLLDNAIEALEHVPLEERELSIKTKVKSNCIVIKVENPFCENIVKEYNGFFKTSKTDACNHGLGIKLLKEITVKYCGEMDIDMRDNYFKVTIILPSIILPAKVDN